MKYDAVRRNLTVPYRAIHDVQLQNLQALKLLDNELKITFLLHKNIKSHSFLPLDRGFFNSV